MNYNRIERDNDGFATDECLDTIGEHLPVLIYEHLTDYPIINYVDEDNWMDWRGDIERSVNYMYWTETECVPQDLIV